MALLLEPIAVTFQIDHDVLYADVEEVLRTHGFDRYDIGRIAHPPVTALEIVVYPPTPENISDGQGHDAGAVLRALADAIDRLSETGGGR